MSAAYSFPSILVVEDSDEDYAAMERILRRSAQPVGLRRCNGAEQTLAFLEDVHTRPRAEGKLPALIVLDLNMPGRDGRFVLKELRSRASWRKIPVVVFSTSSSAEDIAWCYENGANSYHVKDMNYDTFKNAVEQLSSYWLKAARVPGTLEDPPRS